jgi:hypothetical protein
MSYGFSVPCSCKPALPLLYTPKDGVGLRYGWVVYHMDVRLWLWMAFLALVMFEFLIPNYSLSYAFKVSDISLSSWSAFQLQLSALW